MRRLINQQELSPLFRVFKKEKYLLKIKRSVLVENYQCHFLRCMINKTILQYECCKAIYIAYLLLIVYKNYLH